MQKLPVKLITPGMILARDILNEKGIALASAGTEISDKLLFRMENMRIRHAFVKGCPVQLAQYLPRSLDEKLADMEIGFMHVGQNDLMRKFRVLLKAHFIQREKEARVADAVADDDQNG